MNAIINWDKIFTSEQKESEPSEEIKSSQEESDECAQCRSLDHRCSSKRASEPNCVRNLRKSQETAEVGDETKKQAGKEDVQQRPDNQTPGNDQCQYWEDGENGGKNVASPKSANQWLEGHPVTGSLQPTRWDFANSFQACEKLKRNSMKLLKLPRRH